MDLVPGINLQGVIGLIACLESHVHLPKSGSSLILVPQFIVEGACLPQRTNQKDERPRPRFRLIDAVTESHGVFRIRLEHTLPGTVKPVLFSAQLARINLKSTPVSINPGGCRIQQESGLVEKTLQNNRFRGTQLEAEQKSQCDKTQHLDCHLIYAPDMNYFALRFAISELKYS